MVLYVPPASALTEDDVRADLMKAYEAVEKAESIGGDVHRLVTVLDEVARTMPGSSESQLMDAKVRVDAVWAEAYQVGVQGAERITNQLYVVAVVLLVITGFFLVFWRRMSHLFWATWLRMHRGWRVERN